MKQLVVCSENFLKSYSSKVISSGKISIYDRDIQFALINHKEPSFDPDKQPDHVLIRKNAFSCNYRDIAIMIRISEYIEKAGSCQFFPIGSEFSGTVVSTGSNVKNIQVGDKVISDAFYPVDQHDESLAGLPTNKASREMEVIHHKKLAVVPDNMSAGVGAAFTVGAQTVYSMIEKMNIRAGDRILINGIKSNTSLFALNALRNKNVSLCGTSRSKVDESFFRERGMDNIFYVSDEPFEENMHILRYVEEYGKFNGVIDPFSDSYLFKSIGVMDQNSRYITCGLSNQTALPTSEINLTSEIHKILSSNISIIGNCLGSSDNLRNALNDYSENKLNVVIEEEIDSDDVQHFMDRSFRSGERMGKVVFKYSEFVA